MMTIDVEQNSPTAFKHRNESPQLDNKNDKSAPDTTENKENIFSCSVDKEKMDNLNISKVSISSIDDNESHNSDSLDSDSEDEVIPNPNSVIEAFHNGPHLNEVVVLEPRTSGSQPVSAIGSIAVQNSSDITFGNKTYYQGPVTIKQFHLNGEKWKSNGLNGVDNPNFSGGSYEKDAVPRDTKSSTSQPSADDPYSFIKKKKNLYIIIGAIVLLVLTGILTAIAFSKEQSSTVYKIGDGDDSRKNIAINSTIGNDLLINRPPVLRYVTREEWIGQPPKNELADLIKPVSKIIIAHTATKNCTTQASCVLQVRLIQTFHMESRNWDDIGYNFLVGGDGNVYEGRGWDKQGAHTKGFNVDSICIAFIGTFNSILPPPRQIETAKLLIETGVMEKNVREDYKLYGHRQLAPFESPGAVLFENIKTWPHWANDREDLYASN